MRTAILRAAIVATLCVFASNGYAKGSCDNIADKQKKLQCLNQQLQDLQEKQKKQQAAEQKAQQEAQRRTEQRARQDQQRQQQEAHRQAQLKAQQEQQRQQQQAAEKKAQKKAQQEVQQKAQQEQQRQKEEAQRQAQLKAQQEQQRQQQQKAQQLATQNRQLSQSGRCDNIADKQTKLQCLNQQLQDLQEKQKKQLALEQRAQQDVQVKAQQEQQRQKEEAQRQAQLKAQQEQQRQQKGQQLASPNQPLNQSGRCNSISDPQQKLQCLRKDLQAPQDQPQVASKQKGPTARSLTATPAQVASSGSPLEKYANGAPLYGGTSVANSKGSVNPTSRQDTGKSKAQNPQASTTAAAVSAASIASILPSQSQSAGLPSWPGLNSSSPQVYGYDSAEGHGYCTDYVRLVYRNARGVEMPNLGDAKSWYENAKNQGFEVLPASDITKAPPGSIAVWSGGNYGHVGIVKSNDGANSITFAEANWAGPPNANGRSKEAMDFLKHEAITAKFNRVDLNTKTYQNAAARGSYRLIGFILPK